MHIFMCMVLYARKTCLHAHPLKSNQSLAASSHGIQARPVSQGLSAVDFLTSSARTLASPRHVELISFSEGDLYVKDPTGLGGGVI